MTVNIDERLRNAFGPTKLGVAGLVDQLVTAFSGEEVEFERVGDRCVCRWIDGEEPKEVTAPLPATGSDPSWPESPPSATNTSPIPSVPTG